MGHPFLAKCLTKFLDLISKGSPCCKIWGALHNIMRLVTGLAQLPRQILLFAQNTLGYFGLVNQDEILETKTKWWHIKLHFLQLVS